MSGNGSSEVGTYRFKLKTIKERLRATFLVFVNAPDPEHNSLGYLVYGGPEPIHVSIFDNFVAFCVGGTSADVLEVDDYLDLIAHDVHKDWSKGDFHGLQAAKYMRQLLRLVHNYPGDLDTVAAEMIFIDYYGGTGHAVRFDGSQEDFKLGGDRFVVWVGTHTQSTRKVISTIIDRHLPDNTIRSEQFSAVEDRLKAKYPDIKHVMVTSVLQQAHE